MAKVLRLAVAALCFCTTVGREARDVHEKAGSRLRNGPIVGDAGDAIAAAGTPPSAHHAVEKGVRQMPEEVQRQHLIICNAYTSRYSLEVYHVQTLDRLTEGSPITYKECRDVVAALAEGDQLDFKIENADVGTFYASGLPKTKASLFLIPHRRDNTSEMGFESHAFGESENSQIAVVDACQGRSRGSVKIFDVTPEGGPEHSSVEELLQFSSVVTVNAGTYQVALMGDGSQGKHGNARLMGDKVPLHVEGQSNYVVIRVGNSEQVDRAFPEELVVFPRSSALRLGSALLSFVLCALTAANSLSF